MKKRPFYLKLNFLQIYSISMRVIELLRFFHMIYTHVLLKLHRKPQLSNLAQFKNHLRF